MKTKSRNESSGCAILAFLSGWVTLPSKKNSLDRRPPTPLAKGMPGMPGMGDFFLKVGGKGRQAEEEKMIGMGF